MTRHGNGTAKVFLCISTVELAACNVDIFYNAVDADGATGFCRITAIKGTVGQSQLIHPNIVRIAVGVIYIRLHIDGTATTGIRITFTTDSICKNTTVQAEGLQSQRAGSAIVVLDLNRRTRTVFEADILSKQTCCAGIQTNCLIILGIDQVLTVQRQITGSLIACGRSASNCQTGAGIDVEHVGIGADELA